MQQIYVLRMPFAANASKNFDSSTNITAFGYVKCFLLPTFFGWKGANLKTKRVIKFDFQLGHLQLSNCFVFFLTSVVLCAAVAP